MSQTDEHETTNGRGPRVRGFRVGVVLLLVAFVPLLGMSAVTWKAVGDARDVAAGASRAERLAHEAVMLTELDGAVFDEMIWTVIDRVAVSIGAPRSLLTAFLGADPAAQIELAVDRTDQLVIEAHDVELQADLEAARAEGLGPDTVVSRYEDVAALIDSQLDSVLGELATSPSGAAGGAELLGAVATLQVAIDARNAMSEAFYAYFATEFDLRGAPSVELARLIAARDAYRASLDSLRQLTTDAPAAAAGLELVESDLALTEFVAAIDTLVTESLVNGVPESSAPVSLASVTQNLDGFSAVYTAASESSATMFALLDSTATAVLRVAGEARADADREIAGSYALATALGLATLLSAWLAARFIVRPLRSLRQLADGLRVGQEPLAYEPAGPAEVKAAGIAINDAATHFELVTRQARALAAGSLDADVLNAEAPGGLGAAVHHAVGTLRSALAQQDEFRRRLAHEASHDGLTKLANRNASLAQLTRSLARTSRSGAQLAVLFIDLDRFKDVNDHHGHQAGDTVLATVAQRLVTHVREGDHVGRLGGDEFVVIAEPVDGVAEAIGLAQRLLDTLAEPIELEHVRVSIAASIGIAINDAPHLTADELLRDADLAVYRAKAHGRARIEICNEDLRNELAATADLSLAIRHAIDHDELVLYYQPIVDTHSQDLHALEALIRWQRPDHDDLVPPDEFIGFAERSDLIIDIDRWVIDAAAAQIASWRNDPNYRDTPVAINISGRHLAHHDFVRHILEPINEHGIEPHDIIVEITESALLDDLAAAATKLQRLRDAGVLVSIDDFGTGYTSLAHLRTLPVDVLKIDRSFTSHAATNAHEASIVKLIIDTAHLIGATVTAEGVETQLEATKLAGLGSDNLQGYYFARPQHPERVLFRTDLDTARPH